MDATAQAIAAAVALQRAGRLDDALAALAQLRERAPDDVGVLRQTGLVLQQQGRLQEAAEAYRAALALQPASAELMLLQGMVLRDLGQLAAARLLAARAAALRPRDAAVQLLHGSVLARLGELQPAEHALRRALALQPASADGWFYLGTVQHRRQQWNDAALCYRRALDLQAAAGLPDDPRLLYNLGVCEESQERYADAARWRERAGAAAPLRSGALVRLAQVQALSCDWDGVARTTGALEQALSVPGGGGSDDHPEPFVLMFLPLSAAAGRELLARRHAQVRAVAAQSRPASPPPAAHAPAGPRPLRVGYLSPDFGAHAVGSLVQGVFAAHDRRQMQVHGYSLRRHGDDTAARIRAGCDRFLDLSQASPAQAAQAIASERLDVLVDLGGFTRGAMPEVLALRPAPVQLGWLGFLHSYGGGGLVDALILDDALVPPGSEAGFAEPVLRLPGFALPGFALPGQAPPAPQPLQRQRAGFGLPVQRFLFASFNNAYKLDAPLFGSWLRILAACPHADLVLTVPDAAAARLRAGFVAAGLDPARLHLVPKLAPALHQQRMAACDLFLDAFRYQGGATAIGAAAAGLPVLTLAGDTPVSRLGLAMNRLLGLEALVAAGRGDYEATAIALAQGPARLAALRAQLAAAVPASGLLDPARTARGLEGLFREAAAAAAR